MTGTRFRNGLYIYMLRQFFKGLAAPGVSCRSEVPHLGAYRIELPRGGAYKTELPHQGAVLQDRWLLIAAFVER